MTGEEKMAVLVVAVLGAVVAILIGCITLASLHDSPMNRCWEMCGGRVVRFIGAQRGIGGAPEICECLTDPRLTVR